MKKIATIISFLIFIFIGIIGIIGIFVWHKKSDRYKKSDQDKKSDRYKKSDQDKKSDIIRAMIDDYGLNYNFSINIKNPLRSFKNKKKSLRKQFTKNFFDKNDPDLELFCKDIFYKIEENLQKNEKSLQYVNKYYSPRYRFNKNYESLNHNYFSFFINSSTSVMKIVFHKMGEENEEDEENKENKENKENEEDENEENEEEEEKYESDESKKIRINIGSNIDEPIQDFTVFLQNTDISTFMEIFEKYVLNHTVKNKNENSVTKIFKKYNNLTLQKNITKYIEDIYKKFKSNNNETSTNNYLIKKNKNEKFKIIINIMETLRGEIRLIISIMIIKA